MSFESTLAQASIVGNIGIIALLTFSAWIAVSIPVWISAKAVKANKSGFGRAMLATLAGSIVYFLVALFTDGIVAIVAGFIAWAAVFKTVFDIGWKKAFGIAIISTIIMFVAIVGIALLLGVSGNPITGLQSI